MGTQEIQLPVTKIFNEYGSYIFHLALSITRNHSLAEDICQDIYIKFIEKNIHSHRNPKALISRITVNHAYNVLRNQKTRKRHEQEISDPKITVEDAEDMHEIRKHLHELDDKLRIPITLRYIAGYKLKEIAKKLSLPMPTVQSRLQTGLEQLRKKLKKSGYASLAPFLESALQDLLNSPVRFNKKFTKNLLSRFGETKTTWGGEIAFWALGLCSLAVLIFIFPGIRDKISKSTLLQEKIITFPKKVLEANGKLTEIFPPRKTIREGGRKITNNSEKIIYRSILPTSLKINQSG
jgi:RNA polymerase sigma-70 factor (ECF subfamily)